MDCLLPVEQRSMESDRMEKETRYLTFALTKGRLAKKTLELLEQIGITCEEMKDPASRKLIFVNEDLKIRFFSRRDRTFQRMWSTGLRISVLSERIR